jgi:hypothetical protein
MIYSKDLVALHFGAKNYDLTEAKNLTHLLINSKLKNQFE